METATRYAFGSAKEATQTVFPGFLLIVGVVILLSLGGYQWLSASVEERVEDKDQAEEEAEPGKRRNERGR